MTTTSDKRGEGDKLRYLGTVPGTLLETLGIDVRLAEVDRVEATMPVTTVHHQPHGILHGGASVALAETVASIGASLELGTKQRAVGLEINANHLRQVVSGTVTAVATPVHKGRRTVALQRGTQQPLVVTQRLPFLRKPVRRRLTSMRVRARTTAETGEMPQMQPRAPTQEANREEATRQSLSPPRRRLGAWCSPVRLSFRLHVRRVRGAGGRTTVVAAPSHRTQR